MSDFFQHPQALVESSRVGGGTRVWAFAHVLPQAVIGRDCNICDHVFIENEVKVGDRVTIKCGVQLWDGITVGDDVFVGPNVTFANDKFPRSKQYPAEYLKTVVHHHASIGANATILPGITIGEYAMIGAGAVVTRNVPAYAIVTGNPARIHGYVNSSAVAQQVAIAPAERMPQFEKVKGVKIHEMPIITDLRGSISVGEMPKNLPFIPKRYFVVFDVPGQEVRGEHAHKACHQFLVCVKGSVSLLVDDGVSREEVVMNSPRLGVHIPPKVWGVQYKYSADSVLLVLASEPYDAKDYLRNYQEFLQYVREEPASA